MQMQAPLGDSMLLAESASGRDGGYSWWIKLLDIAHAVFQGSILLLAYMYIQRCSKTE